MVALFDTLPVFVRASWDAQGRAIRDPDGHPRWGGKQTPPSVNEEVFIRVNRCGPAVVTGYSVEGDEETGRWLNARCRMLNPPDDFLRRHKGQNVEIHVPGVVLSPITNELRSLTYKVEFQREERDCPANVEARAKGKRLIYDYAVLINGERRGRFAARPFRRGYTFEALDGEGIRVTPWTYTSGEEVNSKADFEPTVRKALTIGAIPTTAQVEAKKRAAAEARAALEKEQQDERTRMRQWRALFGIEPAASSTPAPDLIFRLAVQLETLTDAAQELREGRLHPLFDGTVRASRDVIEDFKKAFPRYAAVDPAER